MQDQNYRRYTGSLLENLSSVAVGSFVGFLLLGGIVAAIFVWPSYNRYQVRMDETNQIQVNTLYGAPFRIG